MPVGQALGKEEQKSREEIQKTAYCNDHLEVSKAKISTFQKSKVPAIRYYSRAPPIISARAFQPYFLYIHSVVVIVL
jgi:hypothetical protein